MRHTFRTVTRFNGFGLLAALGLVGFSADLPEQAVQQKPVTFYEHIAPLLERKCLPCHLPDGPGPFELRTYEQVKKHATLIRTQVLSRSMPPTLFASHFGELSEAPPLSDEEAVLLQTWMQQGLVEGKGREIKVGKSPSSSPTIRIKSKSAKPVRAEGTPYWQVTIVDLPKEGGHLTGLDLRPDSPKALRYANIAILAGEASASGASSLETAGGVDYPPQSLVGTWAPGYRPIRFPEGVSRPIPPNSKLLVQAHLQPTGKQESGGFQVALHLEKTAGSRPSEWLTLSKDPFAIEANTSETIKLEHKLSRPMELLAVLPEARFYASKIHLTVHYPDHSSKIIFITDRWSPYWQGNYSFPNPVSLPAGSTLEAEFTYNNDERCPMNEGKKPQRVVSGFGIGDEVCKMHMLLVPGRG